jgi:transposase-like protein
MARHNSSSRTEPVSEAFPLSFFACPNPDCADFNKFDAGNLSVAERMGKNKTIRRLYCKTCGQRFSEREGSLMAGTKLQQEVVVRIIKCLGYGCSIEATADICEVDPRTVERLLQKAGKRAEDFHRLQLEKLQQPIEAVQLDELHGRVSKPPKKGQDTKSQSIVQKAVRGFIRRWK